MKKLLALTILLAASAATAEPIDYVPPTAPRDFFIDRFDAAQVVVDTTADGVGVGADLANSMGGYAFPRTLTVSLDGNGKATATTGDGRLRLTTEGSAASFELFYGTDALHDPTVVLSGTATDYFSYVDELSPGAVLGLTSQMIGGDAWIAEIFTRQQFGFELYRPFRDGNGLRLRLDLPADTTAVLGGLEVAFAVPGGIPVPEPAGLALFGLGVASVMRLRARRKLPTP